MASENLSGRAGWFLLLAGFIGSIFASPTLFAQEGVTEEVVITGSRIKQDPLSKNAPVLNISSEDIKRSGLTSVADILQRLTISGGDLNVRFNSSGNFGFPPDGGGVGAGSARVSLRFLGPKRTLVLVDGNRWIAGASASGVPGDVDLNTIPVSIIDRIEVLEDGASAIYGSDAIAGVVNIITKSDFDGFEVSAYAGEYTEGDGATQEYYVSWGATTEDLNVFFNANFTDQSRVNSSDRDCQTLLPKPCVSLSHGSTFTPQGRVVFDDPNTGSFINCALDVGVTGAPVYDPLNPCGATDDYHPWRSDDSAGAGTTDRFNFGAFNLLVTPSERVGMFSQAAYQVTDNTSIYFKGSFNNRKSTNQAAPEPLCFGDCGTGSLFDVTVVDATQIWNPFGFTTAASDFFTRRPIEGGPRIFRQDVDTWYVGAGLRGAFEAGSRQMFWDANAAWSRNQANQIKTGGYNARKLMQALGPDAGCTGAPTAAAVQPWVPFNFFGGLAGGSGTITQDMLDWAATTQQDSSEQELFDFTANLTGDIVDMPAGPLGFAIGFEHRKHEGEFIPDSVVQAGDTAGLPAKATRGKFDVDEIYVEFNVPIVAEATGFHRLDASVAIRSSDYDTSGSETTSKLGLRWAPVEDLLFRGTYAEGFRAPSIGELFGAASRFDATITDLCWDMLGLISGTPQPPNVQANCIVNGVPMDGSYVQPSAQLSVFTGGNNTLKPETSESFQIGLVYSPNWVDNQGWVESLAFELDFYDISIEDAIEPFDAQSLLDVCNLTNDPFACGFIGRAATGTINQFDNQLANIGEIETSGYDINVFYTSPAGNSGQWALSWFNTILDEYTETLLDASGAVVLVRNLEGRTENNRGKPEWKSTFVIDWLRGDWGASWTVRHTDDMMERCTDFQDGGAFSLTAEGACSNPSSVSDSLSENKLDATTFNDVQVTYAPADLAGGGWEFAFGVNNLFDEDPPLSYSASLNGYDASSYDPPGSQFWYLRASLRR